MDMQKQNIRVDGEEVLKKNGNKTSLINKKKCLKVKWKGKEVEGGGHPRLTNEPINIKTHSVHKLKKKTKLNKMSL